MPFNHHTHSWGTNSKGAFCLLCGEFVKNAEEKEEFMEPMSTSPRHPTLMWPKKEHKLSEKEIEMGDHFDPWTR